LLIHKKNRSKIGRSPALDVQFPRQNHRSKEGARANRYFLPGDAWHMTHRCRRRERLLVVA
jgi:hypothetical protein